MSRKLTLPIEKLVTIEHQTELDAFTGKGEERLFVKLWLSARTSGLLKEISDRDFKTLVTLATYMDKDGYCFPSQTTLAHDLGISRQMVNERIKSLAAFRFQGKPVLLVNQKQRASNGRFAHNGYRVLPISNLTIFGERKLTISQQRGPASRQPARATVSRKLDTAKSKRPTVSTPTVTVQLDTNKSQKETRTKKQIIKEESIEQQQAVVVALTSLTSRKIHKKTAERLVRDFPIEQVTQQIEVHDWLLDHNPKQVSRNSAGWLVKAIEELYPPPRGFKSKAEIAQEQAEELRQVEEQSQEHHRLAEEQKPVAPAYIIRLWQTAYGEIQLQMPREAFDTWLRSAKLLKGRKRNGSIRLTIGVHNVYAREWLEYRLKKVVHRVVTQIAKCEVELTFKVMSNDQ